MKSSDPNEIKLIEIDVDGRKGFAKVRAKDVALISQFSWYLEKTPNGELEAYAIIQGEKVSITNLCNHHALAQSAPGRN